MVLDASLLSTQHYKVRIKGKVEQSRKGVVPSPTHWCSSYRKGSLRVTLDYGRQLYLLIPSVLCRLPLFITSMAHFSLLNPIPISWLYILTACMRVSSSFSFFANSLMSSMYIRWLIFSCDLRSLYPAVHFLSMWLRDIMAIMNSKGDSASALKIPLRIFVSAKLFPLAVSSTLQVFMVFSVKFMTSCDILYILR